MNRRRILAAAALGLAALAGCTSDSNDLREVELLRQRISGGEAGGGAGSVTRAQVDAAGVAFMLAEVVRRDTLASLIPVGQNRGVRTWTTGDGTTLAIRDGMIVGTRGLAPDLMSADVPAVGALARGDTVRRVHHDLGPDDQTRRRSYRCEGKVMGGETVEVLDRSYETTLIAETCEGAEVGFTNRYWVQENGFVRQSEQWVGPDVGFLRLMRADG